MQLDEMKRIWNSPDAAVPALDVAAMEERVREKIRCEESRATTSELGLVAITGLTGLFLAVSAALERQPLSGYATAVPLLGIAVHVHLGRRRRLRETRGFDDSLRGRVDRTLANLDATMARDRRFFWWFIVPMMVGTALSVPAGDPRAARVWLVQAVAWILAWAVTRWEIRAHSVPRRRKLVQLRAELASG